MSIESSLSPSEILVVWARFLFRKVKSELEELSQSSVLAGVWGEAGTDMTGERLGGECRTGFWETGGIKLFGGE